MSSTNKTSQPKAKLSWRQWLGQYGIYLIFGLGLFLRFWAISQQDIFFYFDQARDATVSRQIIENKDFKIMGPSVSGTNDSVYHGVLYYYLIAPVYTFSHGSPIAVAYFLALMGSLAIFVIYKLGLEIWQKKSVALMAAFLLSVSTISIHQNTWLSNPQLGSLFIPLSYLMIWRVFFQNKKLRWTDWTVLGLLTALATQSALQSIVILGSIAVAFIYRTWTEKGLKFIRPVYILAFLIPFMLGITPMLLTELLMWRRGILTPESLNLGDHTANILVNLTRTGDRYIAMFKLIFSPQWTWLILVGVIPILAFVKKSPTKILVWSLLFVTGPLWLLLWHYRDPIHTFIGLETVFYLVLAAGLIETWRYKVWAKVVTFLIIIFFAVTQLTALVNLKTQLAQLYGIQKGAFLSAQLKLIDRTYTETNGQPFTISTLTSPYNINTTWAYLYHWYGLQKYGYQPEFVGPDQTGYPGDSMLTNTENPANLHFTILEPDTTLSDKQVADFQAEQTKTVRAVKQTWQFGTLELQLR